MKDFDLSCGDVDSDGLDNNAKITATIVDDTGWLVLDDANRQYPGVYGTLSRGYGDISNQSLQKSGLDVQLMSIKPSIRAQP